MDIEVDTPEQVISFLFIMQEPMAKKILFTILISIFLTSCISITAGSKSPVSQQEFVTATLAPTAIRWIPATSTVLPETKTPNSAIAAPANCRNAAILLRDVTIPDNTQVKAGETFTKTWEFQNTGTCPWTNYTMKFSTGDSMNAPPSASIADTLPNEKVQVSVDLTAPSTDGIYTASFTLNDPAGNVIAIGIEKSFWVKVVVGNILVIQTSPSAPLGGNTNCAYSENAGYISEIVSLINQARAEANIPALNVNAQLTQAAQSHSVDMACSNLLSHFGSDGSGWWDRISRTGYFSTHGPSVAEIIAIGTPQDAMNQWRSDPAHWEFVLSASTEIGVGYAYYSKSDFGGYITVDLGG
jgi:uncharacterized protein YkwD